MSFCCHVITFYSVGIQLATPVWKVNMCLALVFLISPDSKNPSWLKSEGQPLLPQLAHGKRHGVYKTILSVQTISFSLVLLHELQSMLNISLLLG